MRARGGAHSTAVGDEDDIGPQPAVASVSLVGLDRELPVRDRLGLIQKLVLQSAPSVPLANAPHMFNVTHAAARGERRHDTPTATTIVGLGEVEKSRTGSRSVT